MVTGIILLIIAGTAFGAILLTREWAMERRGIDLDREAMHKEDVQKFSGKQKTVLALLLLPAALFLVVTLLFIVVTVVATGIGATPPPA